MKLELLTNATVVDDAIRFVHEKSKDNETFQDNDRRVQITDQVF